MNVALIVPCHNEAARLDEYYWSQLLEFGICVIFVDDGSSDGTLHILNSISKKYNGRTFVIQNATNSGKANAIREGINFYFNEIFQEFEVFGFLDADAAFEAEEVQRICTLAATKFHQGFTSIWTSRVKLLGRRIQRNALRHYLARIIATYLSRGLGQFPYDSQSGFKLFKYSRDFRIVFEKRFETRWFFDLEVLSRLHSLGLNDKIWEEPVESWTDVEGSKLNSLRELFRIAIEIIKIRRILWLGTGSNRRPHDFQSRARTN